MDIPFFYYFNDDEPKITIYRSFDEEVTMTSVTDVNSILEFIENNRYKLIMNFDNESIKRVIEK